MWRWLHEMLVTPATFTNYEFMISTLKATLRNEKQLDFIKQYYFESDQALQHALDKIQIDAKK